VEVGEVTTNMVEVIGEDEVTTNMVEEAKLVIHSSVVM